MNRSQIPPVFKREFLGYFRSPVAYVFLVAFLVISVSLAIPSFSRLPISSASCPMPC